MGAHAAVMSPAGSVHRTAAVMGGRIWHWGRDPTVAVGVATVCAVWWWSCCECWRGVVSYAPVCVMRTSVLFMCTCVRHVCASCLCVTCVRLCVLSRGRMGRSVSTESGRSRVWFRVVPSGRRKAWGVFIQGEIPRFLTKKTLIKI